MFNCPTPTISQTLATSGARTADGATTAVVGFAPAKLLEVSLEVSATAGRPGRRFLVAIEESADGVAWAPRASFDVRGPGRQAAVLLAPIADRLRARWEVVGDQASIDFAATAKGI